MTFDKMGGTALSCAPQDKERTAVYYEKIREIVNENLPAGQFDVAAEAERIRTIMKRDEPALLAQWERDLSLGALSASLREITRKQLITQRRASRQVATQKQIQRAVQTQTLTPFDRQISVGRGYKRIGLLTGGDLEILAQDNQTRSTYFRLESHFYLELARRVGNKTVEQAVTEEEYTNLYNNVKTSMHA